MFIEMQTKRLTEEETNYLENYARVFADTKGYLKEDEALVVKASETFFSYENNQYYTITYDGTQHKDNQVKVKRNAVNYMKGGANKDMRELIKETGEINGFTKIRC